MKHRIRIVISIPRLFTVLAVIGVMTAVNAAYLRPTSAASNGNPYGYLDYCTHSGSTTYIYGWAADPQVTTASSAPTIAVRAGNNSDGVQTDLASYRNSPITSFIQRHYPGDPTPGEYGYVAAFNNLYQGTTYTVGGTIFNVGSGANVAASVNQQSNIDGVTRNVFIGGKLPDACLTTRPAPTPTPGTPPPPAPAPAPTPAPAPKSSSGSTKKSSPTTPSTPAATAVPAPTADANAKSDSGTISAKLTFPAGNASAFSISYGVQGGQLTTTPGQAVDGDPVEVELDNLQPKTTYTYEIIRTNSAGTIATSPAATFTTEGYTIGIQFTDAKGKPVSGVSGMIDRDAGTQRKSGKDGWLRFTGQTDGTHTVSYTYQGKKFSEEFDTSTAPLPDDPSKVVSLTDTVDVSKLAVPGDTQKSGGSTVGVIIGILAAILLAVGAWFLVRLLRKRRQAAYLDAPLDTSGTDIFDRKAAEDVIKHAPPAQPLPVHAGQSLRDMVVESIQQQGLPTNGPIPNVPGHPGVTIDAPAEPVALEPYTPPVAPPFVPPQQSAPVVPIPPPQTPAPAEHPDSEDDTTIQIQH